MSHRDGAGVLGDREGMKKSSECKAFLACGRPWVQSPAQPKQEGKRGRGVKTATLLVSSLLLSQRRLYFPIKQKNKKSLYWFELERKGRFRKVSAIKEFREGLGAIAPVVV